MSAKRLSKRDRAYYLVGRTVMRLLEPLPWPPEQRTVLLTMHDLISDALTPEDFDAICEGTQGYTFISSADMEPELPLPLIEAPPGTEPIHTTEVLLRRGVFRTFPHWRG